MYWSSCTNCYVNLIDYTEVLSDVLAALFLSLWGTKDCKLKLVSKYLLPLIKNTEWKQFLIKCLKSFLIKNFPHSYLFTSVVLLGQWQLWAECSEFITMVLGKGYTLLFPCFVRTIPFFWMFLPEMSDLHMTLHSSASVPVDCGDPAHSGPVGSCLQPLAPPFNSCLMSLWTASGKSWGDLMWRERRPENTEAWKEFKFLVSSICLALPWNIFFSTIVSLVDSEVG